MGRVGRLGPGGGWYLMSCWWQRKPCRKMRGRSFVVSDAFKQGKVPLGGGCWADTRHLLFPHPPLAKVSPWSLRTEHRSWYSRQAELLARTPLGLVLTWAFLPSPHPTRLLFEQWPSPAPGQGQGPRHNCDKAGGALRQPPPACS